MTAAEKKKLNRQSIRKWFVAIALDSGIVLGFLYTGGVSEIYTNFLILVHVVCWLTAFSCTLGALFFAFFNVILEKMGPQLIAASNNDQSAQTKMQDFAYGMLKVKASKQSWWYTTYRGFIEFGVLLFIAIAMGHWTLFIAYGAAWATGWWLSGSASGAYDKLPADWKSADTVGDGVPDDETELLKHASLNPVSKALLVAKEKKEEEARQEEEARESLVDALMDSDV
jgi:hypothetical protein